MTGAQVPAPEAVLFDWDNTLVDNWPVIQAAMNAALSAFDLVPWTLEETLRRVSKSARDAFPVMFGDHWREAQAIFYSHFEAHHLEALHPLEGAGEMLSVLCGLGVYLGIVSNKRGDLLRTEAAHLGWSRYFGRVVGANDAAEDKPAVAPVDLALGDSGIMRGPAVWLVGDGRIDLECARNAGCTAILFGEGRLTPEDIAAERPAAQVTEHAALATLVRTRRATISG